MKSRIMIFYVLLAMGGLVLVVRLFELQIVLGKKNLALAEGNRIRQEAIKAPRGIIFDRQNRPLVRNVPVYRLEEASEPSDSEPFQIITREEALKIKAEGSEAAERLKVAVGREYLYGSSLAHVLGYLDWEFRGTTGVEEAYDRVLQGQDGGEIYEVDTRGIKVREIDRVEPVSGQDLHLFLDAELSKTAFEALADQAGAVVVTDAKTGQVLAMVSSPSFDPNLFIGLRPEVSREIHFGDVPGRTPREEVVKGWLEDPKKPMFNRAIGGAYPPGSTFKIVTAAAGLEEGKIDENTKIRDEGVIKIGPYSYNNWLFTKYGRTEGEIGVVRAIKRSTDTFFYKVGEFLGAESLARWAKSFGLGKRTGIDLGGEVEGLVPSPDWKEETMGERWFLGNTYHLAIGQADLLATPLQINMMTGVIANDGQLCRPVIADFSPRKNTSAESCQDLQLNSKTLSLIKEGLKEACLPEGTAAVFFNGIKISEDESENIFVACKTGTAEFGPVKENGLRDTHAWLTAFAPADNPEIVVTALVEGGGEGSTVAAPIVKKVMEKWFEK